MEFSPFNHVVKLCLQGMDLEEKGQSDKAFQLFMQGWREAANDHEKFLTSYYVARHQKDVKERLQWLENTLQFALQLNDDAVNSALPALYHKIAGCYDGLNNPEKAIELNELSISLKYNPSDKGPFYHGTKADLKVGDLLTAGEISNYKSEIKMNHIYFTALVNGAGLAAALAAGEGKERVYIVEPTGEYENDPNLTDKKFPGNPSRSYRSEAPLRITGEVTEWVRQTPEELQKFREKLAVSKGDIIN